MEANILKLKQLFLASLLSVGFSSHATEDMYGIFSAGFSETEFNDVKVDGAGYKFAVGYQFHPQWYIELGYQQLADESLSAVPTTLSGVQSFEPGMQGDALFAAFLGKASSNTGELFYRIGVLKADVKGQQLLAGVSECEVGQATAVNLGNDGQYTYCDYDDGVIAGVLGLGFDFFIGPRSMIRAEVEHVSGENGLSVNAAYVGFRYNF